MTLDAWQWALAVVAAVVVGISKSGIGGLGMLAVVIFAQILPAKQATGAVLPLLCIGDLVGASFYRKHASWQHLWRLFPWTAAGVGIGYLALGRIDDRQARVLIGVIILTLAGLHLLRRRFGVLEVISTIMLNFVALSIIGWLVRGPLQEPARINPQSATLPASM